MKKSEKITSGILIALGCLSMLGAVIQSDAVKGLGIMTTASPLPLVFSKFRGVENFSSDYEMKILYKDGSTDAIVVTPEIYDRAGGPYNRRNPYGAILAYGPMLDKPHEIVLRNEIMQYSACGKGSFMREVGVTKPIQHFEVLVKSKAHEGKIWTFTVDCPQEG